MISSRIAQELNAQINAEFASAYIYLGMAAWFHEQSLDGFGNWMEVQFAEEQDHALRLMHYLIERGGSLSLETIARPEAEYGDVNDVFEQVLAHEQKITGLINDLYSLAEQEKDYATRSHLQWFVDEQVEEEATVAGILDHLSLAGDDRSALLFLDEKLGRRQATTGQE